MLRRAWRLFSIAWTIVWAAVFLISTSGQPPDQDVANNFFFIILIPWVVSVLARGIAAVHLRGKAQ